MNVTYSKSIAGIERVFDILDIEPEICEKEKALVFSGQEDVRIQFRNVYFRYDKTAAESILNDISFTVEPEEKVALVGASGCGKSTVISLLARFYDIDSGKIILAAGICMITHWKAFTARWELFFRRQYCFRERLRKMSGTQN